jgi:hypothetical protein
MMNFISNPHLFEVGVLEQFIPDPSNSKRYIRATYTLNTRNQTARFIAQNLDYGGNAPPFQVLDFRFSNARLFIFELCINQTCCLLSTVLAMPEILISLSHTIWTAAAGSTQRQ